MTDFKFLANLYKKGLLTGVRRQKYKKEIAEKILLDKRKHFMLKDGTEIDLTLLEKKEDPNQRTFGLPQNFRGVKDD